MRTTRAPRRRRLGARRREGLDHQRRRRALLRRLRARPTRPPGKRGITAFVVPADAPGFAVGAPGGEARPARLAHRRRLSSTAAASRPATCSGEVGQGFKIALATLDHSRLGHRGAGGGHPPARARAGGRLRPGAGAVRRADRRAPGDPFQARHDGDRARGGARPHLVRGARAEHESATPAASPPGQGSTPREAANRACWEALQIHGGNGFSEEYEIARLYRDVRVTTIYEGTQRDAAAGDRAPAARHVSAQGAAA